MGAIGKLPSLLLREASSCGLIIGFDFCNLLIYKASQKKKKRICRRVDKIPAASGTSRKTGKGTSGHTGKTDQGYYYKACFASHKSLVKAFYLLS
jgi:hypothetical protein